MKKILIISIFLLLSNISLGGEYKIFPNKSFIFPLGGNEKIMPIYHYKMNDENLPVTNQIDGSGPIDTASITLLSDKGLLESGSIYTTKSRDSYFNIESFSDVIKSNDDFTISFYQKNLSKDRYGVLLMINRLWNDSSQGIQIMASTARTGNYELIYENGIQVVSDVSPSNTQFHHIVIQRDSGVINFYINKELVSSTSISDDYLINEDADWRICGGQAGDNGWECYLDEVKIFDVAIDEEEIKDL